MPKIKVKGQAVQTGETNGRTHTRTPPTQATRSIIRGGVSVQNAVGWTSILNRGQFLPRDTMLTRYMPSSCVCLSVCMSVTLRYCIKMAKRIYKERHMIAQRIYFSDAKDHGEIRTGSPRSGAPNAGGVG